MFKEIITSKHYWIRVLLLALGFIIIFSLLEHFMEYGGIDFEAFLESRIRYGQWKRYLLSRIVGGGLYGIVMAYYFEIRKRK
ncbi:hypothetical protein [Aquimarina brevivitae]|uniref:Uncharacterized protein n=1 Tax=Aquimarina brevivitae TaxID=323412 RepID=A0A4Q7NYY7_9FLAO|nr:hypothetical protein [Aquimarina brevivitae]RZS92208.1 hypothetical protein EV197_2844 [Aquimarina brevivitae]